MVSFTIVSVLYGILGSACTGFLCPLDAMVVISTIGSSGRVAMAGYGVRMGWSCVRMGWSCVGMGRPVMRV